MKKADLIIIVFIGILAFALLGLQMRNSRQGSPLVVEIYLSGRLHDSFPLDGKSREIVIDGEYGYNVLQINGYVVSIADSDCPSRECVYTAEISHSGQVIACLPHRLTVRLVGGGRGEYDAIVG